MILFLNFAPIEFMGGAEKWMYETASYVNKTEKAVLMSVAPQISNIYGRLVLGRTYESRVKTLDPIPHNSIGWKTFIPFTKSYRTTRAFFRDARLVYMRYELPEVCLGIYFGGWGIFKKLIVGLHSTLMYQDPLTLMDRIHNIIYTSPLSKLILRSAKKVHVITQRDKTFFKNTFRLQNTVFVPNSAAMSPTSERLPTNPQELRILFVGEICKKKGVDILIDVIKNAPSHFHFDIAGNGNMEEDLTETVSRTNTVVYHGHLEQAKLEKLYASADVLFLPSRAEGFPTVFHEAMRYGLQIVNSQHCHIGLPKYIEYSASSNGSSEYLDILRKIAIYTRLNRKKDIVSFHEEHFSNEKVMNLLCAKVFNLSS